MAQARVPAGNSKGGQFASGGGKGGKKISTKITSLQKARASVKKSISKLEKKSSQNLSVLKQSMVRSVTKFPKSRSATVSNAYHIGKGK